MCDGIGPLSFLYHVIDGRGTPEARQLSRASLPCTTVMFDGITVQRTYTFNNENKREKIKNSQNEFLNLKLAQKLTNKQNQRAYE